MTILKLYHFGEITLFSKRLVINQILELKPITFCCFFFNFRLFIQIRFGRMQKINKHIKQFCSNKYLLSLVVYS